MSPDSRKGGFLVEWKLFIKEASFCWRLSRLFPLITLQFLHFMFSQNSECQTFHMKTANVTVSCSHTAARSASTQQQFYEKLSYETYCDAFASIIKKSSEILNPSSHFGAASCGFLMPSHTVCKTQTVDDWCALNTHSVNEASGGFLVVKAIICVLFPCLCCNNDHVNGRPTNLQKQISLSPWRWRYKICHIGRKWLRTLNSAS